MICFRLMYWSQLMLKKTGVMVSAVILGITALIIFDRYRTPSDVTPMGSNEETIAWIALATAIVSMVTALVGLMQKLIELRKR